MKRFIPFLLSALFVFAFAAIGNAQNEKNSGTSADRTVEITDKVDVTSQFDKAKNETTVEFQMMGIANTSPQKILVSVSVTYPGEKLKSTPDDVVFILSIASPGSYKYSDVMAMTVKADGKKLPDVLMINFVKERLDEEYLETVGTRMKFDTFKKIAKAKAVEFQLENTKFQLTEGNIQRFAELLKLLQVD